MQFTSGSSTSQTRSPLEMMELASSLSPGSKKSSSASLSLLSFVQFSLISSASLFSTRMLSERKTSRTGFRLMTRKLPFLRRVTNPRRLKKSQLKVTNQRAMVTPSLLKESEVLTGFNTHARSSKVS